MKNEKTRQEITFEMVVESRRGKIFVSKKKEDEEKEE
jgi:hypothetical protein